ncbi:MAG: hypothetical protein JXO51_10605 [Candidatus Aminicenantes bacterium]|nr:hypothetical protein [Candidatus Aminicenantes bacterium]
MKRILWLSLLVPSLLLVSACDASVNRSQYLADGGRSGRMTSVNGSIHVGARCTVGGGCRTVNGRITVGDGSRVGRLDTVNGRIRVGAGVEVDGDATTVNGPVECGAGSRVHGGVTTVNGRIELADAVVDEDLVTVNGRVLLRDGSVVRGDIVIKGRRGFFSGGRRLQVRLEGGSTVEGGIDVRDPGNEVEVYISKDSAVKGKIRNAKVIKE